jgi:3-deoxy-7-phosphoheptulonate synthase
MEEQDFSMRRVWGPTPRYPLVQSYEPPKNKFVIIAGSCSVEGVEQVHQIADFVGRYGATHLRGGIFRAGTYPGKTFGLVEQDLIKHYYGAAKFARLENIIEVLDYRPEALDRVAPYCDCFQVGARQMQNYTLLRTLGAHKKPVFLKRHPGSTLDEWLGAAEHLLSGGVEELYLVERGSSTHLNHVRHDLSLSIIGAVKALTKIPVICDASHGTGRRDLVESMTLAGVAAGAGGVLLEVHTDPSKSLSDPDQAIEPEKFKTIMKKIKLIREVI